MYLVNGEDIDVKEVELLSYVLYNDRTTIKTNSSIFPYDILCALETITKVSGILAIFARNLGNRKTE